MFFHWFCETVRNHNHCVDPSAQVTHHIWLVLKLPTSVPNLFFTVSAFYFCSVSQQLSQSVHTTLIHHTAALTSKSKRPCAPCKIGTTPSSERVRRFDHFHELINPCFHHRVRNPRGQDLITSFDDNCLILAHSTLVVALITTHFDLI